ncbi:hypothetical protein OIU85_015507, partial [Salix viminalis]
KLSKKNWRNLHGRVLNLRRQLPQAQVGHLLMSKQAPLLPQRHQDHPLKKVSTDKYRNYAVVAGTITALGALGWYLKSGGKKQEEVQG